MSILEMHQRIEAYDSKSIGIGALPREISDIEERLGLRLPGSYQEFLSRYGWARFASNEFYGIGADVPPHLLLSVNTIAERTTMQPTLPHSLVPVLNDGAGNHYCLATERMINGECPVVFWDHNAGPDQQLTQEGDSFSEWLVKFLDQT